MKIEKTAEDTITVRGSIGDIFGGILSMGIVLFAYLFTLFLVAVVCIILLGLFIIALPFLALWGIGYGFYKLGNWFGECIDAMASW